MKLSRGFFCREEKNIRCFKTKSLFILRSDSESKITKSTNSHSTAFYCFRMVKRPFRSDVKINSHAFYITICRNSQKAFRDFKILTPREKIRCGHALRSDASCRLSERRAAVVIRNRRFSGLDFDQVTLELGVRTVNKRVFWIVRETY